MQTIAIDRVDARYHIPASAWREQVRLQHIVRDGLTRTLEGAVSREGIAPGEHICIDAVRVLTTLRLREPDSMLASTIGDAVAAAIRRLIDAGSASVVRYTTRSHALIDLTASAMAGDFRRAWAWTQMGLLRSDFPLRRGDAAERILHRLAAEPTLIVAVLSHVARFHRASLRDLLTHGSPRAWTAVATAALRAAGASTMLSGATVSRLERDPAAPLPDRRVIRVVERMLATSTLLADARTVPQLPRDTFSALVALAVLEAEPSATRTSLEWPEVAHAVARMTATTIASWTDDDRVPSRIDVVESHGNEPGPIEQRRVNQADRVDAVDCEPGSVARQPARDVAAAKPAAAIAASTDPVAALEVLSVRRMASTHHGGLLYLVNVLRRMDVVDRLEQDTLWADRGLRWLLHQLAMILVPVSPNDAAALAFAGLPPDAEPPSTRQAPPTVNELEALTQLGPAVAQALRAHLRESGATMTADAIALLDTICRRDASIVADPGWIEAHFAADTVSLDIRRAGLDVNPEWVPWLGIVLRFVYA